MKKSMKLIAEDFESSAYRTPQYLTFHRTFKREFTALLKPYISRIEFITPNHFDVAGFFEMNDGKIWYFSISDLRWSKGAMLIRTAKDFKDYTGGQNRYVNIGEDFAWNLIYFLTGEDIDIKGEKA